MHDWKKTILKQTDIMRSAIEVLNNEALRIVIVVDDERRMVGTVTDGDIRRGLVKHQSLDISLIDVMCKESTVAVADESRDAVLAKMKKLDLLQIPVLDKERRVVGLEMLQDLLNTARHDNPVFLMAGGFGKRLRPLTNHVPKPLLKVGTKPILETILDQFISAGFHDFYISTHYKAEMVREHFRDGSDWDVSIKYIHEEEPLGTAGALGLLPKDLTKLPILMMNCDLLTKIDFEQLLEFHLDQDCDATMCVRQYDYQVPYGVIKAKDHRITSIIEKPMHKFFVNAGIYVLSPRILGTVDGTSYLDMPHMLESIIEQGGQVNMFPVHEYWLDVGAHEDFNTANMEFLDNF
jgi:dTDP-glucose pyrophosphorylase/predicted transcriptional regulator